MLAKLLSLILKRVTNQRMILVTAEAKNTFLFKTAEDDNMKNQKLVSLDKLARVWSKSFWNSLPETQRTGKTATCKSMLPVPKNKSYLFSILYHLYISRVLSLKKPKHLHRSWVIVLHSDFIQLHILGFFKHTVKILQYRTVIWDFWNIYFHQKSRHFICTPHSPKQPAQYS